MDILKVTQKRYQLYLCPCFRFPPRRAVMAPESSISPLGGSAASVSAVCAEPAAARTSPHQRKASPVASTQAGAQGAVGLERSST